MSARPPVAGVRLHPSGPVLWVESTVPDLQPRAFCLLHTPNGEWTSRCAVAPHQLAGEATPLPDHRVLRTLTPHGAQNHEPARSLRVRIEESLNSTRCEVQVEPDGSRAWLLHPESENPSEQARGLTSKLGLPVAARNPQGRVTDPELPPLLAQVRYRDESAIVERISVFRGEIALREENELRTVKLEDWYTHGKVENN